MRYLQTADVPLDRLRPFPGNARRGRVDKVSRSLLENGQYKSLTVRVDDPDDPTAGGVILAGNHTAIAMRGMGMATARCELIDCDDARARAINLADNGSHEGGGYDHDALLELLQEGPLDGTTYSDDDLIALLDADMVRDPGQDDTGSYNYDPDDDLPESIPLERKSNGGERPTMNHVEIGKIKIRATDDELDAIYAAHKEYLRQHGTDYGFTGWLARDPAVR